MKNAYPFLAVITFVISRTTAQDVGVKSFTITTPATLTTGVCNAETAYTFNIVFCIVSGTEDNTVGTVRLHYADGDNYHTATTKGSGYTATLGDITSDITVDTVGDTSITGATATIPVDGSCSSYTHICATIIVGEALGDESTVANDNACIALDGGTTSTRHCPIANCADPGSVENAQKQGSTFEHNDTVTYTCNVDYDLVGEGTLTCNDGQWDNDVPKCSGTATTDGGDTAADTATTKGGEIAAECGGGTNVHGLYYSLIATLAFVGMAYFW
ncbi:uncharacterized protein [Ptychodera flava]|uniref:uncharacterized protein n=1 Tax=Ptychodera flava TaxID=63121 RepID=UPI003969F37F